KGIDVKLGKNPGGGCAARTSTDTGGAYLFTHVSPGSYYIYVDIPNYGMDSTRLVTIDVQNPTSVNNNYAVDSNVVYIDTVAHTNGIKQTSFITNTVKVYPNPAQGNFTVEVSNNQKQQLQVLDISGKIVLTQTIQSKTTIDASLFENGVYFVQLKSEAGVSIQKIVMQH
ncbi:MAG TPA: T9SS type A sorting domain-containing protein, partial [Bacteroidia bacterium]|nr:T9SS type A sorting domain-containing protein [Bacteroidia bacterium]